VVAAIIMVVVPLTTNKYKMGDDECCSVWSKWFIQL